MATETVILTAAEFDALPHTDGFELVRGELVERPMVSPRSGFVAGEIYARLREFLLANPIGWAFPDGVGFLLRVHELESIRKPDASVVLRSRLPDGRIPDVSFPFPPDLAVEVVSPSDIHSAVDEKIHEYLEAGTPRVWLARPTVRRITVFENNGRETTYGPDDFLTSEPLLPGFHLRVGDVFPASEA